MIMDDLELKKLTDQIQGELKTIKEINQELGKEVAKKASAERIEDLIAKSSTHETTVNKLSEQMTALELKMKDFKLKTGPRSFFGDFHKDYMEKGRSLQVKDGKPIHGVPYEFTLNVDPRTLFKASTIDETTELSDSDMGTAVIVPMRVPGVEKLPDRRVRLIDVMGRGVTGSNRVTWVERSARTEGTASVAEAGQYAQSDLTYIQKSAEVEKIGTHIKVTGEALEDWDEMLTQIKNELLPSVERRLETQCYSGTGTTPQLDGITTTGVAYSTDAHTGKITDPNKFDAVLCAGTQVKEYEFFPTYGLMSIGDHDQMLVVKDSNSRYNVPAFVTIQNGIISVNGIQIIPTSLVTDDDLLVGDFSKVTLYIKRGIEIKIWDQDSTDPEYDLKTITASVRAAVKFPAPNTYAFVYDTFTDIISDITKVVA